MRIVSIFAAILFLVTALGAFDLYYDPHARTAGGYSLVALPLAGFVVMVVLLVIKPQSTSKAG